jgi:DNA repair exonuclease SbcCD ATPase subunit
MCHSCSYIDFTQFNSALIVGKIDNNELYSNGVGKTTIFKAIEYVLFNQADVNLEKIIRDDMASCKVVLDFNIDDQEYRLSRVRSKKGATDISLLQRNNIIGPDDEVYHTLYKNDIYKAICEDDLINKYWKDIGGRRAADTEKELNKLIKTNFLAFRSTLHFIQNDFTGLSTVTPGKRKGILREALSLGVYSKLEKIAKEKASAISKDIDRHKTLIDSLGNPSVDYQLFKNQLVDVDNELNIQQIVLTNVNDSLVLHTSKLNDLISAHSVLESKFSSLVLKDKLLFSEKSKIETSIKEYQTKKSNIIKAATSIVEEVKLLKENQARLISIDYSQIDIILEKISLIKEEIARHSVNIQNNLTKYEELKVPVPDDSVCKHCRQKLTTEHKLLCKQQVNDELKQCQELIKISKSEVAKLNAIIIKEQQIINSLNISKQQLENINILIVNKSKEIQDKKSIHMEYKQLLDKFNQDLIDKLSEIDLVKEDLKNSSIDEANNIQNQINIVKNNIIEINKQLFLINKQITHLNSSKAVLAHNLDQENKAIIKQNELRANLKILEDKFIIYPHVIQSFSSVGIPNLIIQNVLDDLQVESNLLLSQLKPGLQLSFVIEKTKGDGSQDDTLEINYHINGKSRDYDQLSGAMKLAVIFSLKLGLSFLLQKMIGTDIRFLLLDEIDQSLDKASVDAFADIVKFFQKDFTILIITHNDRLKDKFSHAVLVDQDINMVSKAQVVSSW